MKNTVAHDSSPIVIRSGASDFADPKRDEARDQAPRAELPHPGTPGADPGGITARTLDALRAPP